MIRPDQRIALYMEGAFEEGTGKMGLGCLRYSTNPIVAVIDSRRAGQDARDFTGIDRSVPCVATVAEAAALGADVLVLGIAPPGGLIPSAWYPVLDQAVGLGMNLVNGLHDLLGPRYPDLQDGQWIWDIRIEPAGIGVGTGAARELSNRRVLFIGTDMAVGKMTAGLELMRVAREHHTRTEFVATGQIGMTITGKGIPLDAIRIDFAAGAVEREVMTARDAELVIVEGQGSLIHPASSANLPLLRGSCPTHLILCHRANMTHLPRMPWLRVPELPLIAQLYEDLGEACGIFPRPRTVAIALNTGHLDAAEAAAAVAMTERETGLPTTDPIRDGAEKLYRAVMA